MEQKMISVIIPTYNRKEKLKECMESVLGQSYREIEVIVVDDASTDGTEKLFYEISDKRLKYFRYDTNRGACYARNYGAERAEGELLAFQDSDDLWHPDKLEKQYGLEEFLAENRASTQTMLMRRFVWEKLRFDENIRRYQDWDFGIRAAGEFKLCYLPEALVESEVGMDSISARVKSYPHLLHLYHKHEALYQQYPNSRAVMNRRLGKRVHSAEPELAAVHFKRSFEISHSFYDFCYWTTDRLRAKLRKQHTFRCCKKAK